ncbi:hypothetical protein Syun_013403 [Stephania yunnanensis]|uniref:Uncharacterized protein n=1 Tax=Stephania yunnanensis TaxID=152371 RepID=A0AAP0K2P3_9MAGN
MGGGAHVMKRIPSIKFPPRRSKFSGSATHTQVASDIGEDGHQTFYSNSEVPAPPANTAVGGKATLQPKRTPVSDKEIDAILLGGIF